MGKIRRTGRLRDFSSKTPIEVERWDGRKEDFFGRSKTGTDERVIGPRSESFPMMDGWKIDGDNLQDERDRRIRDT